MAGRKLTEREKAERAAKRIVKKEEKELGPLFEDQAQPMRDVDEVLVERRMGAARNMERFWEMNDKGLEHLQVLALRRRLVALGMTEEELDAASQYVKHLYPDMHINLFNGILRDRFGVPYTMESIWRKCSTCGMYHAPGQAVCYERPRAELTRSPVFILKGDP